MSLETMTKIGSYTVPSNAASFTMSNIPQGYSDLLIKVSSKTTYNNDYDLVYFTINGDATAANYFYARLQGEGSTSTTTTGNGGVYIRTSGSSTAANNFFGNAEVTIFNYSGNAYKPFSVDSAEEINAIGGVISLFNGMYYGSAPVTSITFYPNNASIAANTTVTLYGLKNAAKTAGNSIKATGGNIVFDGTYVYHVFPSTGAFVPTQPLTADVLQIAGGGGSSVVASGGGGAGGLLGYSNQFLVPSSYAVTVGAGGAGVNERDSVGTQGSSSQFGTLTASAGGGGGAGYPNSGNKTGGSGGSGGGGSGTSGNVGGTATPAGQGNNGGGGDPTSGMGTGGGGGGAGAAGGNGSLSYSGAGGNGSSAYSSWGVATGQGQNVSGTYYFAGGGSGGAYSTSVARDAGYGGGGKGSAGTGATPGANGSANTGGGAGGTGGITGATGATGGSGIVIIRYKG